MTPAPDSAAGVEDRKMLRARVELALDEWRRAAVPAGGASSAVGGPHLLECLEQAGLRVELAELVPPPAPAPRVWGARWRLPWRRLAHCETATYTPERADQAARRYYVRVGLDPATLALLEVFVRPRGPYGTDEGRIMDDVGVVISLALQYGCPLDVLRHSIGRLETKPLGAHSPIGAVVDSMVEQRWEIERTWHPKPAGYVLRTMGALPVRPLAAGEGKP